jgi:hypothetical protein
LQDQRTNALRDAFTNPDSVDSTTGLPTTNALRKVMAVDPELGVKLQEDTLDAQVKRAQAQHYKTEAGKSNFDFASSAAGIGYNAYDAAKKAGKPETDAIAAGQAARNEAAKNNGGVISDDLEDQIVGSPFDPAKALALASSNSEFAKSRSEAAATERADKNIDLGNRRLDYQEKHGDEVLAAALNRGEQGKWQVLTDPTQKDAKGNPIQYRYNPETGQSTTLDASQPFKPGGAAKMGGGGQGGEFTPKMGALMAATAEQGVSLPTGFRSKAQQIELYQGLLDRNPDKSPDEIAKMLKTGQIEFGAQKKETQTAANIAGKVQVFANELYKNLPLLRSAAKDVPRGNWVDLTNLLQTADTHISDPKLKTLKGYINSTMQAYDGLGSRGGMDKDKREANRKLLLSADGPEAFEAQLKVFEKEAQIAKDSAYEATKSPELDAPPSNAGHGIAAPSSKADYDALPSGAHYSKPGDAPGTYRVKP